MSEEEVALPYDPLAHYGPKPQVEKRAYIVRLYSEGWSMSRIAEHVGVVRESVRQILHKAGADIRPRGGVTGMRRRSR